MEVRTAQRFGRMNNIRTEPLRGFIPPLTVFGDAVFGDDIRRIGMVRMARSEQRRLQIELMIRRPAQKAIAGDVDPGCDMEQGFGIVLTGGRCMSGIDHQTCPLTREELDRIVNGTAFRLTTMWGAEHAKHKCAVLFRRDPQYLDGSGHAGQCFSLEQCRCKTLPLGQPMALHDTRCTFGTHWKGTSETNAFVRSRCTARGFGPENLNNLNNKHGIT